MTALERERLWQKYNRKWREYIPKYQKAFNKDLRRKGRQVAEQIGNQPLIELERFKIGNSTETLLRDLYINVGQEFTTIQDRDIKSRIPKFETKDFTVTDDFWADFVDTWLLSEGGQKITTIDSTTRADILAVIQSELAAGADLGLGTDEIARNIKRELTQGSYLVKAAFRAERIARTEVVGASNLASFATANSEGADLVDKVWIARDDSRTREAHADEEADSNRKPLPLDQNFRVTGLKHPHGPGPASQVVNCFPGYEETSIDTKSIRKVFRSFYSGEVFTITTNKGKITATPNHPILTSRGWVAFKEIQKGDKLINSHSVESIAAMKVNNTKTPISEVFDSAAIKSMIVRKDGIGVNFYGDIINQNIDIVNINRGLWSGVKAMTGDNVTNILFIIANLRLSLFFCLSLFNRGLYKKLFRFVSNGFMRFTGAFLSLLRVAEPQSVSLGAATNGQTKLFQSSIDNAAIYAKSLGYRQNRLAGMVSFSEVLGVNTKPFHDYVYTLETKGQIYEINGFVVRNCRCVIGYVEKGTRRLI